MWVKRRDLTPNSILPLTKTFFSLPLFILFLGWNRSFNVGSGRSCIAISPISVFTRVPRIPNEWNEMNLSGVTRYSSSQLRVMNGKYFYCILCTLEWDIDTGTVSPTGFLIGDGMQAKRTQRGVNEKDKNQKLWTQHSFFPKNLVGSVRIGMPTTTMQNKENPVAELRIFERRI